MKAESDDTLVTKEIYNDFSDFIAKQCEKHSPYDVALNLSLLCSALVEAATDEVISLVPIMKKDKKSYVESQRVIMKLRGGE